MVASVEAAREMLTRSDDLVLVERGTPRSVWMRCPCGCGSFVPINVDPRIRPHWEFRKCDGMISVFPSVWRDSDCGAHFILWDNTVWLCTSWMRSRPLLTEGSIRRFLGIKE